MRLYRFSVLVAFILTTTVTKSQDIIWGRMIGSDREEYVLNHVTDNAGNIYISGKTTGNIGGDNLGQNDGFLTKLSPSGDIVWSRQFGSEADEDIQWSAIDESGNVYITGFTKGNLYGRNSGKEDLFIIKYTGDGILKWVTQTGTDSSDMAKGICADRDGNIYITGTTAGKMGDETFGKTDCFLVKLDSIGNILKTVQFGTAADDLGYSVAAGIDNDIFVCGTTWGDLGGRSNGAVDGFTGHFTTTLDKPEFQQFGTDGFDIPLVLHPGKDNNLYIAGSTSGSFASPQAGEGDCFILKQDQNGSIVWKKQFGTEHHDGIRGIDIDNSASDRIFISGIMSLPPEKAFVRSYSKDGEMIWEKTFEAPGIAGGTSGKDIVIDSNKQLTHLGLTHAPLFGPVSGQSDVYIVRMNLK